MQRVKAGLAKHRTGATLTAHCSVSPQPLDIEGELIGAPGGIQGQSKYRLERAVDVEAYVKKNLEYFKEQELNRMRGESGARHGRGRDGEEAAAGKYVDEIII